MFRLVYVGLLCLYSKAFGLTFDSYHTQSEINSHLLSVAENHPDIAQFEELGLSRQGREINMLILGNRTSKSSRKVFFNATHHGNEKSSTEALLAVLNHFIANRTTNLIRKILKGNHIHFIPLVNPDGHADNSRFDSLGKDLNRDYPIPNNDSRNYFTSPETKLIKELTDKHQFHAAASFHSGMEAVLWPWCHTPQRNPLHDVFLQITKKIANSMKMNKYQQSYYDYPTEGEFIDFMYWRYKTLAITLEVSERGTPEPKDLNFYVQRAVRGALTFIREVSNKNIELAAN